MSTEETGRNVSAAAAAGGSPPSFQPYGMHAENPFEYFAWARTEMPISYNEVLDAWLVTRYDDIVSINSDPGTFSSRDSLSTVPGRVVPAEANVRALITMDPPDHTRLRRIVNRGFTPRRVALLDPMIRDIANDLVDGFVEDSVDFITAFASPLPLTVILGMFGIPKHDQPNFLQWTNDLLGLNFGLDMPEPAMEAATSGVRAMHAYLHAMVVDRQADPRDDFVSELLAPNDPTAADVTAEEVVTLLAGMIPAGFATTAELFGNILYQLLVEPGRLAAVSEDFRLIPAVVEESLRFESPLLGVMRTATRHVQLGNMSFPEGANFFLLYGSGNRDEMFAPNSEVFDLRRPNAGRHLSFGHGPHFCVGAPLARSEVRIGLEVILSRLRGLRLAEKDFRPRQNDMALTRGLKTLPITWNEKKPPTRFSA